MPEIIFDEEFKILLPALDKETYASLEANLIQNGCRDSLVLWNGILIDGHNRYEICTKHGIPFNTVDKEFASREEVLIWIISTQVSRRNLTPIQLSHYRGVHYMADKRIVKNDSGKNQYSGVKPQNDTKDQDQSTAGRLSEKYKVSRATINRDAKIAAVIDAIGETSLVAKQKILSRETNISKKLLEGLSGRPTEEIQAVAVKIEEGSFENEETAPHVPAIKANAGRLDLAGVSPLNAAISNITEAFFSERDKIAENGDIPALKKTLRTYIDRLENLYNQI